MYVYIHTYMVCTVCFEEGHTEASTSGDQSGCPLLEYACISSADSRAAGRGEIACRALISSHAFTLVQWNQTG